MMLDKEVNRNELRWYFLMEYEAGFLSIKS